MKLIFPESKINQWAERYTTSCEETDLIALRETVQQVGFLTKPQLKLLAHWKSPRSTPHIEKNSEAFIQEITQFALSAKEERARIESLTLLDGVLWPTASAVLHIFHADPYPILDFRALESVGVKVPNQYSAEFWLGYVNCCRTVADRNALKMRTLDRALWQYSKAATTDAVLN